MPGRAGCSCHGEGIEEKKNYLSGSYFRENARAWGIYLKQLHHCTTFGYYSIILVS